MSPEEMRQDKGLLRTIDFRAKMKNVRKAAQQAYTEGRQTWGINKFAVTLGDMVGQSVPNAIPYFGVYSLLKGSGTQRYEEGIALGLSREENIKRASLFGAADTLEEKIGMGVLGKVPVLGRLLNAGLNKTGLPYNSFRAKYLASETAQIWGNTAAGVLEEGIAEPIVGGTTRTVMSSFLDDERGKTSLSVIPGDILQTLKATRASPLPSTPVVSSNSRNPKSGKTSSTSRNPWPASPLSAVRNPATYALWKSKIPTPATISSPNISKPNGQTTRNKQPAERNRETPPSSVHRKSPSSANSNPSAPCRSAASFPALNQRRKRANTASTLTRKQREPVRRLYLRRKEFPRRTPWRNKRGRCRTTPS